MNNNHYRGFIETCVSYGMDKSAADMLYKQALSGKVLINALIKAQKAGTPLARATVRGRSFANNRHLVNRVLRILDNPSRAERRLLNRHFSGNRAKIDDFRRYISTYDSPATSASPSRGAMWGSSNYFNPLANAHGAPATVGAGVSRGTNAYAEAYAEARHRANLELLRRNGVPIPETPPASQTQVTPPPKTPAVETPATPPPQTPAVETPVTPPPQTPAPQTPPPPQAPVETVSQPVTPGPDVANNAIDEIASGTVNPMGFAQTVAAHPYLSLTAATVPGFMLGSIYGSRNR